MPQVDSLFAELDSHDDAIPVDVLLQWMQTANVSEADVEHYVRFRSERYLRNLMHNGPSYHALVLCWRSGQRSPIHDHVGSACAVKILRGSATETFFERAPNGMIYATGSRVLNTGDICASEDADIHQISNLQVQGDDLITLHLYSPPLITMNVFSMLDDAVTRYLDPINEDFTGGGGI